MTEEQKSEKRKPKGPIKFKIQLSEEQKEAKSFILEHAYNFIKGEAGTGKTMLACQVALDSIFKRERTKIIITRPTVGTEDNGFLPGNLKEKMEPWTVPIVSNMYKMYDSKKIDSLLTDEQIEIISLTHFRGQTFDDAICIVDEFQNLTRSQLQMAVGRLGRNSIMIFCGDREQIDLKDKNNSAIHEVSKIEKSDYVYSVTLTENHRHPAVASVLRLLNEF
jgi:phosphate starvation-inducible protein PhoH and related proteins